jgi:hypothetical protein
MTKGKNGLQNSAQTKRVGQIFKEGWWQPPLKIRSTRSIRVLQVTSQLKKLLLQYFGGFAACLHDVSTCG